MWIKGKKLLFFLFGGVLLAFVLLPLLKMIFSVSPLLLLRTFLDPEVARSIFLTLWASLISTGVAIIFGIPLAYLLARFDFIGRSLIEGIVDLPIVIPHTAAGIALLSVFSQDFFLGRLLSHLGIRFISHFPGIVIGMMFVSAPFLVNSAKEGFRSVDVRLENVSRTLGAGPYRAFFKVALPLARPHILQGIIMMWARGISEFGAVIILCYHPMIAPVLVYERFESFGLRHATPIAACLVLLCLLLFTLLRLVGGKR
jgi:molybdate/tungstate transport system permease protein